jgi:hypothetical protein
MRKTMRRLAAVLALTVLLVPASMTAATAGTVPSGPPGCCVTV